MTNQAQSSLGASPWLLVFTIPWFAFALVFNAEVVEICIRQLAAYAMPMTTGTVEASEITDVIVQGRRNSWRKQWAVYKLNIDYRYQVAGQTYQETQVRYGSITFSQRSIAQGYLDRFPVGKQVPVYYEVEHTDRAILMRGLEPHDVIPILILLPYSLIGIGVGFITLGEWWRNYQGQPPTNYRLTRDAHKLQLRAYVYAPLFGANCAVLASWIVLFFGTCLVHTWWPDWGNGWGLVGFWCLILFGSGISTYVYLRQPAITISRDLVTGQIDVQKFSQPTAAFHAKPDEDPGIVIRLGSILSSYKDTQPFYKTFLRFKGQSPILMPSFSIFSDPERMRTMLKDFFAAETPSAGM